MATRNSGGKPGDHPTSTLGGLLEACGANVAQEKEWIELVDAIAAGDQVALRALYNRAHRVVFTLAVRITSNRETAEEVTLDVFHDVWRRASTYKLENGSVLGWIMNQARSRAIDRLRFEQRKKRSDPHPEGSLMASPTSRPGNAHDLREQSLRLENAMNTLTRDERQAIETAYFSELTYAEAAARLDQPLGTIKTRIRTGLQKLRRALADEVERQ